jgi:hypothetical protein
MMWFLLPPHPTSLKIHYFSPEGLDPLTPAEIRQRYQASVHDRKFLLWSDGDLVGFKCGIDEITLKPAEFQLFAFIKQIPGKGSGTLTLETRSPWRLLLEGKSYSRELEEWFTVFMEELKALFPNRVLEEDWGMDA